MRHTFTCVVRWGDMDALGHVNNVVFADYLQEARVDLLRAHGNGAPTDALAEGTLVVSQHLQYVAPLVFDLEPVRIDVWVAQIKAATFTLAYEVYREDGAGERTTYLTARTVLTPFSFVTERPRRINAEEREQLSRYLVETPLPEVTWGEPHDSGQGHYPVQVRFSDLDVYGHANNVIYLEYFQESRITLLLRRIEAAKGAGLQVGVPPLVVAAVSIEYKRPMVLRAEPYDSWSWVERLGTTSMVIESRICDTDGTLLARAQFVMVFIDAATGASARPDPALRAVFEA